MNRQERFLQELDERVLIGDGAVGTALFAMGVEPETGVERMNLLAPEMVLQLHRDYVAAGSRIIETNTFGANLPNLAKYGVESEEEATKVVTEGARLARLAAGPDVYVAGSVGPLPYIEGEPISAQEQAAILTAQITALLDGGVDVLILESFPSLDDLAAAVTIARSLSSVPIVAQASFGREGKTADGATAETVAARCLEAGADVVGANCGYGILAVTKAAERMVNCAGRVSAYMNAGFPERVEGRLLYLPHEDYIVHAARNLAENGVRLIGGCCGTDPGIIRLIAQSLRELRPPAHLRIRSSVCEPARIAPPAPESPFVLGKTLVELDPPRTLDVSPLIEAARAVRNAGASAVTIADNPLSSVRMDSITVAGILQRECGLPAIPHMTGRDRNKLGLQSAIMGAHALGIRSILCITGDPVRMCQEPNTSGVFDLTSVGLVKMLDEFNHGHRLSSNCRTSLLIGVAVNPNVRTLSGQVDKLKRKMDAGAHFALTQPIFDESRLELLDAAAQAGLDIPIYVGIMPLPSAAAAEFLHNEVPGISIPDKIRARISSYDNPADQRAAGLEIATELLSRISKRTDRFYFVCPRNKVDLVVPLVGLAEGAGG